MNTHDVLKPFTGPGNYQFKSGERVDAREWRTVDRLVAHRYLRPLPPESTPQGASDAPARAFKRGSKEATDGN